MTNNITGCKNAHIVLLCLGYVEFVTVLWLTFIPLCPNFGVLFLPEFSSNRLQALAR